MVNETHLGIKLHSKFTILSTQVLEMSLSVLHFQPLFGQISTFEEDTVGCNKNYWLRLESSRNEAG